MLVLPGCVPATKVRLEFDKTGISDDRWSRMDQECEYDMRKATASASPRTSTEAREEQLYIGCMELKGAKFLRRYRVPA